MQIEPVPAPAVQVELVSKLYGSFAALKRVSCTFAAGGFHVLLGPNGAGKSTLLRVIAGLITPSAGSVTTLGGSPHSNRDRIAYMSHAPMLYDELSAMENLRYFSAATPGATCDCAGSPEMALRAVGLDPTLTRPISQFSQGMRQRVSMARALVGDPELLLLDEPFSNMDAAGARELVQLLLDFRTWPLSGAADGRTVIVTTHQYELVSDVADSVVEMRTGAVVTRQGSHSVKTNAARLLDRLGIDYELREYTVDPADLSAPAVAIKIGMPVEQVFKTLLCTLQGGEHVFAVVPGDAELDLKKLAMTAGAKKAELASLKDVEPLTGYIRGGVTVMGAKKAFRAFADETLELFDVVSVSAGQRGLQLLLAPADYLRASEATVADLVKAAGA